MNQEPIAAIATAFGKGGIAIVRISGDGTEAILSKVFMPKNRKALPLQSHCLTYGTIMENGVKLDECMAVLMRAPRSYTREDVAEIQVHGGFAVASLVLDLCIKHGARLAVNGEFTRRAFENGRIDLTRAEAVMDVIAAEGERSARAAARELDGGVIRFIREAQSDLYTLMAGVEAAIDYPDEIDETEATEKLVSCCEALSIKLLSAVDERAARILRSGLSVAFCGVPNVGKSSLMNRLLGEDRAIVTDVPGTTRDVLTGTLTINGIPVYLHDMAGLRDTDDVIEALGVSRARDVIAHADCVLIVIDSSQSITAAQLALINASYDSQVLLVLNKNDLSACVTEGDLAVLRPCTPIVSVNAVSELGTDALKAYFAAFATETDGLLLTNQRHITQAKAAADCLKDDVAAIGAGDSIDLVAVHLRRTMSALNTITGEDVDERLLDQIFASFCVGK